MPPRTPCQADEDNVSRALAAPSGTRPSMGKEPWEVQGLGKERERTAVSIYLQAEGTLGGCEQSEGSLQPQSRPSSPDGPSCLPESVEACANGDGVRVPRHSSSSLQAHGIRHAG